jgi:hypothetical protein
MSRGDRTWGDIVRTLIKIVGVLCLIGAACADVPVNAAADS